jgi:arabinogalactan oligomer/maltooligosaccharide transport system permease protein
LSLPARAISFFSGTVGLVLKMFLLGVLNALAVWAAVILADHRKWIAVAVLVAATVGIDIIYMSPLAGAVPLKFLIPGTIFLLGFQVAPIAYNVNVAFTNWSTGHILVKHEAIDGIKRNSLSQTESSRAYTMAAARDADGNLVLILSDDDSGATFVGTKEKLTPIPRDSVRLNVDGEIVSASGYTLVKENELFKLDQQLQEFTVPASESSSIRPEGLDTAIELTPTLRYDAKTDTFVRIKDGLVFRDNGRGSFTAANGEELEPGWKTSVGFRNFDRLFTNPAVRRPFLKVFAWTLTFATLTVFLSFALGLFLAIALDRSGMRLQRVYRSSLVIPYAMPAFLSLLVWGGLLNDDFGVVNHLLHTDIPWLFNANWAKVSVILVSIWLTFPYFFLVSMGALQSIPAELTEAARVDGGGPWQLFRRVTLPLLLVAVAPLMIASFAFNFNNFNNVYLLTQGGPGTSDDVAGATDILISYTYKLAFAAGKGQDYGLASAVSIVIFFIVASISAAAFWRTKSLENLR